MSASTFYRTAPHAGRWAVVYPVPGSLRGELAALCDFRTEHAARMHAAWLNAGLPRFTPRRDPAITELLAAMPVARATRRAQALTEGAAR
ncbi:MAG TPA: hypothetical protein PLW24_17620 [Burkholderiaceae bacterium]|nr:hypothetical protein [Burkholderiaceae bacterium]HNB45339.1 hypothetical protein [Burkholderiaceae bacterium]HNG81298.1 hypothetical protein [Burkholderiaceae bacterium]